MVPAPSHRVSRVPWYSGSCCARFGFAYGAFTLSGRSFQFLSAAFPRALCSPYPSMLRILVWASPVSLAATSGIDFSFLSSGYLDVSVRRVPPAWLWIHHAVAEDFSAGFPHSDICGSVPVCSSPQLFAAYRVLLRPLVPRHPPCAFSCLTLFHGGIFQTAHEPLPLLRLAWRRTGSFFLLFLLFSDVVYRVLQTFDNRFNGWFSSSPSIWFWFQYSVFKVQTD